MLLFIIYDFDLNCLTPSFVGEWFPSIRTVILDWLDMGPEGNPCTPAFDGFLATYLNIRPQAYLRRDAITHNNIAVEMLFKSLLGGNIHRSPEWVAFAEGFNMHCRNGFTLSKAIRGISGGMGGGPELLLSYLVTSHIQEPSALRDLLHFECSSRSTQSLQSALGTSTITHQSLIQDFLEGQGLPNPTLFDELVRPNINTNIIDLSTLHTPMFRCKMFLFASTGSPLLDASMDKIE
ncbi:hypothetical protein H0H93_014635, partial [Arthromyces matolae]